MISGSIEIFDVDEQGDERVIIAHGPRQFAGELDLFNDQPILVSACTAADSEILRVGRAQLRQMVTAEPDIGELLMRAFILRRMALVRHNLAGVVLVGDRHGADTLRIERFLTRNNYPHRTLDVDVPGEAAGVLHGFGLDRSELPVVIDGSERILRNPSDTVLADALGIAGAIEPDHVFDVAIVGAGPAGLAAAVYAASEGSIRS